MTPAGVVSTVAGAAGRSGSTDAQGTLALFDNPTGVAVDAGGSIYVADNMNQTIRRIAPGGMVTTFAGSAGKTGSTDGLGGVARFFNPSGVAADGAGNIYVADSGNDLIRKISPAGAVTTVAGLVGNPGSADATGGLARFNQPAGVAVNSAGIVFVADTGNSTIRRITPAKAVTTLAGTAGRFGGVDGAANVASFARPLGLAADALGNVYVADSQGQKIRKVTAAGVVSTFAGSNSGSLDGIGTAAAFDNPSGIALDGAGTLYVADATNNTIRKVTGTAAVTTLAGAGPSPGSADGIACLSRLSGPNLAAVDSAGNVYVADTGNDTIRKITPAGVVSTLAGLAGQAGWADGQGSAARFSSPTGVAVDGAGVVYVVDSLNQTIREISAAGKVTTIAGAVGVPGDIDGAPLQARFSYPTGIAVDPAGRLYVTDTGNFTIRKLVLKGAAAVSTLAGQPGNPGASDGAGPAAQFYLTTGIALDSSGNLYVADTFNRTIRMITPAGSVSTLPAWPARTIAPVSTRQSTARFHAPTGVAVDGSGNVYVTDDTNCTVRRVTPAGVVTTLAGAQGAVGNGDGVGSAARFTEPYGIAVDSAGKVYVTDAFCDTLRVGVQAFPPVITVQPVGLKVAAGQSATFTVAATSVLPLSYQWYWNGVMLPGKTAATVTYGAVTAKYSGDFTVVVANADGSVTSSAATLTVQ